jgi:hypothetical protein
VHKIDCEVENPHALSMDSHDRAQTPETPLLRKHESAWVTLETVGKARADVVVVGTALRLGQECAGDQAQD